MEAQLSPAPGARGAHLGRCEAVLSPAVYHAIYLEELTAAELTEKLAQLFRVPAQQIQQIYKQGPTGIHVLVSDEVTPTCPTGTAGKLGGIPWEVHLGERHHQGTFWEGLPRFGGKF